MPELHVSSDTVLLSVEDTPGFIHSEGLTAASARRASDLLTENHHIFHTRWNTGFHNHITHHLLCMWALGASSEELQIMYDYNAPYQAPLAKKVIELDLTNPVLFKECLGKDECYLDFLKFFRQEIDAKGMRGVVQEYVLKDDERANDILCRMYTDLVHPMIHLGCALEFRQPSILAEALAAACVHENWPKDFLQPAEEMALKQPDHESSTILEIIESLRNDPEIKNGVKDDDPFNKIADGFLKRISGQKLAPFLSQFRVCPTPGDLQRKCSEMMHTCGYMLAAAQRPGKREAMDFVLLHNATLASHYPALLAVDWISDQDKARLLEQKARVDMVQYASCGSPELYPGRVTNYVSLHPQHGWPDLIRRSIIYRDEGHAVKLMRFLYGLEQLYADTGVEMPIRKEDFQKVAHMAMDSIERAMEPGGRHIPDEKKASVKKMVGFGGEMVLNNMTRWVFYDGLPKAWDFVPNLTSGQ